MIAFLTDYGTRDGFPAVCHGVIARIAPAVRVLDLTHDVPPQNVRHGAAVLVRAARHLPPAIYLAVVDPGVGTARRGVALRAGESVLVGPDNGLLMPAADVLGGVDEARELDNAALFLPEVGATFHGRDVFAPVAAHLAAGVALSEVGPVLDPATLLRLPAPHWSYAQGELSAEVTYVDHFGNLQLAPAGGLLREFEGAVVEVRRPSEPGVLGTARTAVTFGDVPAGELILYVDSDGRLALAASNASAGHKLGVEGGDVLVLRRRWT